MLGLLRDGGSWLKELLHIRRPPKPANETGHGFSVASLVAHLRTPVLRLLNYKCDPPFKILSAMHGVLTSPKENKALSRPKPNVSWVDILGTRWPHILRIL